MKIPFLLLFGAIVLTQSPPTFAGPTCAAKSAPCCCTESAPTTAKLSDKSVYQLGGDWTNDAGRSFQLASLAGRPQLVAMFFANCQYACPLLVYQMQQIEAALPDTLRSKVGLVLVSFDTQRDTVAALRNYRRQHGLDPARWTLLRGSPAAVQDLAAVLGVQFKQDADGQFRHSNLITLLNSTGEIVYQKTGLNLQTQPMVERAEGLARR